MVESGYSTETILELAKVSSNINDLRKSNGLSEADYPLSLEKLRELWEALSDTEEIKPTIPQLKKRIKYCRNPMEKKKLQHELNKVYKEKKRKR